jgi:hypothetical protein
MIRSFATRLRTNWRFARLNPRQRCGYDARSLTRVKRRVRATGHEAKPRPTTCGPRCCNPRTLEHHWNWYLYGIDMVFIWDLYGIDMHWNGWRGALVWEGCPETTMQGASCMFFVSIQTRSCRRPWPPNGWPALKRARETAWHSIVEPPAGVRGAIIFRPAWASRAGRRRGP